MSEPTTVWTPFDGQSEITQTTNPQLATEASLGLLTEVGDNLVVDDLSITNVPATVWTEDNSQ